MTLFVLILAVAILMTTILLALSWPHRAMPGIGFLLLVLAALDVWLFGKLVELLVTSLPAKVFWANIQYLGIAILPPAFFTLVWVITGRTWALRSGLFKALCLVPLMTTLVIWSNEAHRFFRTSVELVMQGPFPVISTTHGWWFYVHTAFSYALILGAVVVLFHSAFRSDERSRTESLLLVAAALFPLVFNLGFLFGIMPEWPLDLTPFSLLLTTSLLFVLCVKYRIYDVIRMGWDQFSQTASNAIFIVNVDDIVVAATSSATGFMVHNTTNPVGRTLTEVAPAISAAVARVSGHDACYTETTLLTDDGQRVFDLDVRPIAKRGIRAFVGTYRYAERHHPFKRT